MIRRPEVLCAIIFILLAANNSVAQNIGDPFVSPEEIIDKGIKLHDDEKYDEAIALYKTICKSDSAYNKAQYEMALSYVSAKKYNEAIAILRPQLEKEPNPLKRDIYLSLGNALDYNKQPDSALALYERGQKEFPYYHRFYYERGIVYSGTKEWSKALDNFKMALKRNFFHGASHLRIGTMAAEAKKPALALMALQMYCMVNNNAKNLGQVVGIMEKIAGNEFTPENEVPDNLFSFASSLDVVDQVILSKAALSPKYKSKTDLDYNIVKQLQALCEQLPDTEKNGDWLLNTYVSFYRTLFKANMFEGAVLYTLQNLDAKDIKKEAKSNAKKLEAFTSWAANGLGEVRSNQTITDDGKQTYARFWFNDDGLYAKGVKNDAKEQTGPWIYYHPNGYRSSEGTFVKGQKKGIWKYYNNDGSLRAMENTDEHGELQGESFLYFAHGAMSQKLKYKDGKLDGDITVFNPNGSLKTTIKFKDGKRNGLKTDYTDTGIKEEETNQVDDVVNGRYTTFHTNGKVSFECKVVNDKIEGKATYYHDNGAIRITGQFADGKRTGEWTTFNNKGVVISKGMYEEGNEKGTWKYFSDDSKIAKEENYDKGALEGAVKTYDPEGKIYSEHFIKKGKIYSFKYYDKTGAVIAQGEAKKDKLNFVNYSAFRNKIVEGVLDNGKGTGPWKYFYENGQLEYEVNFDNGEKNGIQKYYYKNGKLSNEGKFVDGKREGFYKSYYKNGKVNSMGYYHEGELHGEWQYFYANGKLKGTEYYYNGSEYGYDENCHVDGVVNTEDDITTGFLNGYTQFDTSGQIMNKVKFNCGTGMIRLMDLKNKVNYEGKCVNGSRYSVFTSYFHDGKVKSKQNYIYTKRNGPYQEFYSNGKPYSTGWYTNGKMDSVWNYYNQEGKLIKTYVLQDGDFQGRYTTYYDNGKVEMERNYLDDEKQGVCSYYGPDGILMIQFLYDGGVLRSYTYLDKESKLLPSIPVKDETAAIKTFYPNGNPAVSYTLEKGYLQGTYLTHYLSGKLYSETHYTDNETEGEAKTYYPNGTLKSEQKYFYDELDGPWRTYFENGKISKEDNYLFGEKHGPSKAYDLNGKITRNANCLYDICYE